MSPKPQISRVWLGPRPMPQAYIEYGKKWQELNPDWDVIDFSYNYLYTITENSHVIDDLIKRDAGRCGKELYVQMADVFGYDLIYKFGGIYVNCDIEPVRPMSHLLEYYGVGQSAYAPWEEAWHDQVVNCAIGGPIEHHFWGSVIEHLPERYFSMPGIEMNVSTGPRLLSHVWQTGIGYDFMPLDNNSFNAVHWSQVAVGGNVDGMVDWQNDPRVVGLHHWGHKKDARTNFIENATQ